MSETTQRPAPVVSVDLTPTDVRDAIADWLEKRGILPACYGNDSVRLEGDFHCLSQDIRVVID